MDDVSNNSIATVTVTDLMRMKRDGQRISMLTAYDASFAGLLDRAGVDSVLVGDSLGNVIQGHDSTLPVTVDDMVYHTRAVARGCRRPLLIADLPFLSYSNPDQALANAGRLMQQGHAQMVKLEGGVEFAETIRVLAVNGIPVCGHLGLLPQSVHKLGGYRVQGRDDSGARRMLEDALALQEAGADLLVIECVPSELGEQVSRSLRIPVIGIGAGAGCDGQVLVLYDLLAVGVGPGPRFVKNFLATGGSIQNAVEEYVRAVRDGTYPGPEHEY